MEAKKNLDERFKSISENLKPTQEEIKDQIELNTQEDKREQNSTSNTEVTN
jgi:hypothetical protein